MYLAKGTKVTFKGSGPIYELTHAVETGVKNFPVSVLTQDGRTVFADVQDLVAVVEFKQAEEKEYIKGSKTIQEVFPIGQNVYSLVSLGKPTEFKVTGYELNGAGDVIRVVVKSATKKSDRTRYAYLPHEIRDCADMDINLETSDEFVLDGIKYAVKRDWGLKNGDIVLFYHIVSKVKGIPTTIIRTNQKIHNKKTLSNTLKSIWGSI